MDNFSVPFPQVIRSWIFNIYIYITSSFLYVILSPLTLLGRRGASICFNAWARNISFAAKYILGITYQVRGKVPDRPVIFASKHQSAWDTMIFLLIGREPVYVFKKELLLIPFFNLFMIGFKQIAVDRKNGIKSLKSLVEKTKARLADKRSVIIFPEGTRKRPSEKPDYKPGIAVLYSQVDAPIVPVALNSGLVWPKYAHVKKPGVITIEFLEEMPRSLPKKDFLAELERRIEERQKVICAPGYENIRD